jgi:hypothetical protein
VVTVPVAACEVSRKAAAISLEADQSDKVASLGDGHFADRPTQRFLIA